MSCPFCQPDADRVFHEEHSILCLWDEYPVSEGHALVVPKRHFASWFEASNDEQEGLLKGIEIARQEVERRHRPDGFNIGVNVGEAGGQTIPHLHVHVIPRYAGDVRDPRGGVRYVIPEKGYYMVTRKDVEDVGESYASAPELRAIFGTEENPLLEALGRDLADASSIDLAVAFVTDSGLSQLEPFLIDLFEHQGSMRFLTGDYLDVTEPRALLRLFDWVQEYSPRVEVRVFQTDQHLGFHPKVYLIHRDYAGTTAYVGSSNLTQHALRKGLEWNQRIEGNRDEPPISQISQEFERLFSHHNTSVLSSEWIENYAKRRKIAPTAARVPGIDLDEEAPLEPPTPHSIQEEALEALRVTRAVGNRAGLVVMATGLGKTWLAAFDSVDFDRVLFVAHRQEILNQALRTFRRIRPDANLGLYMGGQYDREADVLFASVQTLGRKNHLTQFDSNRFDYIVVDEFHHAAAKTYRRLIDYFEPNFLLGLTATPERTDGGDLLGLCGENLVFRCDLVDGIRRELLCPFHYFGVPDEVDFANIPWRNGRFDPEKLEHAVATEARAQNAFDQWTKRGQTRTLAFCVSKRHADFMTDFFLSRGAKCVAVHSGPSSAPRTQSLQRLEEGDLQVVFAVDMFNEGVDVPAIDTVMMLRPTESKILWLQQFGRGLRRADGKPHLAVIDYIGNHRCFLQVPMILLPGAGERSGELSRALLALESGELELPVGCSVEYDLEALNILKQLARPTAVSDQIALWYRSFRELHGRRPMASEAYHEGYDPKRLRTSFGSWFGFVKTEGDLSSIEEQTYEVHETFLEALEITPMNKSFKMVTLLAMMAENQFPGSIGIKDLGSQASRIAGRLQLLREEFGDSLEDPVRMRRLLETNPIDAWTGGLGMDGTQYFTYEEGEFTSFKVEGQYVEALQDLTREICDWRLAQYLERLHGELNFAKRIVCKVSHAGSNPMLFLPNRDTHPGIPEGWTSVTVDGETYQANFVKIAVNVIRSTKSEDNYLPHILRSFFGSNAGMTGTSQQAKFEMEDGIYQLRPMGLHSDGPELWKEYMRADIPPLWDLEFSPSKWNQGFVNDGKHMFLMVSLDKQGMAQEHQYEDRFLSPELFQWVSQNRTGRKSPAGERIANHERDGIEVHLFVRDKRRTPRGTAAPFVYCGDVTFLDWEEDKPITVRWKLGQPTSESLAVRFGL